MTTEEWDIKIAAAPTTVRALELVDEAIAAGVDVAELTRLQYRRVPANIEFGERGQSPPWSLCPSCGRESDRDGGAACAVCAP
jgi:hypothetical protein